VKNKIKGKNTDNVDIGRYGKDCDSTIFKRYTLWTSVQTNAAITRDRPLAGTEGPNVPYLFVGDEGFALNKNIPRPFGGSKLSVETKECATIACAEREGMWNAFSEF
jgi:hypothetical protein